MITDRMFMQTMLPALVAVHGSRNAALSHRRRHDEWSELAWSTREVERRKGGERTMSRTDHAHG